MTDRLSLPSRYRRMVEAILREYVPEAEAWAYGSRIQGRSHDGSDLDLVIRSPSLEPLGAELLDLIEAFQESNIPFLVQIHDWAGLPKSFHREIERDYVVVQNSVNCEGAAHTMPSTTWRKVMLGDLIDIGHGFAFKGEFIHDEPQGDLLLTPGNFAIGGGFKGDKFKFYDGPVEQDYVLQEGDLLVTMTDLSKQSDTLGYPALVPASTDGRRYLHNQRLGKVLPRGTAELHTGFLYYLMCSAEYRDEVLAGATGTTVKHTSPDRIRQFTFGLPPLPEQRAIARVLGALDDKIELNRRMNETLEEMARALFKSWFVDFGPVRAKMEGRWRLGESLAGLPADLYDLFPDRLVDSELGEIPEGWGVRAFGGLLKDVIGGDWGKESPDNTNSKGVSIIRGTDLPQLRNGGTGSVPFRYTTAKKVERRVLEDGDLVIEVSGGSPTQPTGRSIIITKDILGRFPSKVVCASFCRRLRPLSWEVGLVAHQHLDYLNSVGKMWEYQLQSTGISNFQTRRFLEEEQVLWPGDSLVAEFSKLITPIVRHITRNESKVLADKRDALLPKLVSGEVGVGEAT